MRVPALLLLACVACAAGDVIKIYSEEEAEPLVQLEASQQQLAQEEPQEPETVFRVDQDLDGSLRVTGMLQSFRVDGANTASINQLLSRPRASFLDVSWSNWVDQRMEVLDMFQNLMSPLPRCPHIKPESSSLDTNMVSYLASSRFGPAILTTYAQTFQDDEENDFDYEEVNIPKGKPISKSYEEASLLEDLSADADKAFQREEQEPRVLNQQQPGIGFFGANIKSPQDQGIYAADLDGSSESLQPNIRSEPPLRYKTFENFIPEQSQPSDNFYLRDSPAADAHQIVGFALFLLLCTGCIYVWISLLCSCCRLGKELHANKTAERNAARKAAQEELLAPLMPEGAHNLADIEVAASHTPRGSYIVPQATEYVTVAFPLVNGELKM